MGISAFIFNYLFNFQIDLSSLRQPPPDYTAGWETFKTEDFELKYPPGGVIIYNKEGKSGPVYGGHFVPDINDIDRYHQQPGFAVVAVAYDRKDIATGQFLKEWVEMDQQFNATASADTKILTKPSEVIISGKKGYQYYLEASIYKWFSGKRFSVKKDSHAEMFFVPTKFGKHRVIQFENGNKIYLIFESQDPAVSGIIDTLKIPQTYLNGLIRI